MTTTTNFVWDPVSDCVLSELDGTNAVQAVYTNEPQQYGGVLSQRRGTTTSTYHADALGTTRLLTSSTQTTTDTYLYDAWGNLITSSGTTVNPFRWVGRYGYHQDSSTGLVYVRARMYHPIAARWVSVDPKAPHAYFEPFVYCGNMPVVQKDPTGLFYVGSLPPHPCRTKFLKEVKTILTLSGSCLIACLLEPTPGCEIALAAALGATYAGAKAKCLYCCWGTGCPGGTCTF